MLRMAGCRGIENHLHSALQVLTCTNTSNINTSDKILSKLGTFHLKVICKFREAKFGQKYARSNDSFNYVENLLPLLKFVRYSWYCHQEKLLDILLTDPLPQVGRRPLPKS